tara:strand:- start:1594 stop:2250 length:657 start_codon:yes stop_codon:yes gene_type:complete
MSRNLRVHKRNEIRLNQEVERLKAELEKQSQVFSKKINKKNNEIAKLNMQNLGLKEDNIRINKELKKEIKIKKQHYDNHKEAVAERELIKARLYDAQIRRFLRGRSGFEHTPPDYQKLRQMEDKIKELEKEADKHYKWYSKEFDKRKEVVKKKNKHIKQRNKHINTLITHVEIYKECYWEAPQKWRKLVRATFKEAGLSRDLHEFVDYDSDDSEQDCD